MYYRKEQLEMQGKEITEMTDRESRDRFAIFYKLTIEPA